MQPEALIDWRDDLRHRWDRTSWRTRRVEQALRAKGRTASPPIELAACLVFRDEAPYLTEWLEFHRAVGFEHFFLYSHRSTDDWRGAIPKRLIDEGRVTIAQVAIAKPQIVSYHHCLRQARGRVRWLALLDADEFLYPVDPSASLASVLKEFEDAPAVAVNWQMFGTSGHIHKPDGGVVRNYRRVGDGGNKHVKVLVQPELTIRVLNSHQALYIDGRTAVNEQHLPVTGPHSWPSSIERLRINHYWSKSVEEYFLAKLRRGDVMGGQRSATELIEHDRRCTHPSDDAALRFSAEPGTRAD